MEISKDMPVDVEYLSSRLSAGMQTLSKLPYAIIVYLHGDKAISILRLVFNAVTELLNKE